MKPVLRTSGIEVRAASDAAEGSPVVDILGFDGVLLVVSPSRPPNHLVFWCAHGKFCRCSFIKILICAMAFSSELKVHELGTISFGCSTQESSRLITSQPFLLLAIVIACFMV